MIDGLRFAAACVLALAWGAAQAQTSVFLEELTTTEVAARIAKGSTTVLIPIGGTEQSGPAIVLGKHNVRVKVLAGKIAQVLGNALVAPVITYVPKATSTRPRRTCASPERFRFQPRRSRARSKRPRKASARTAFATSCSSAITAATSTARKP